MSSSLSGCMTIPAGPVRLSETTTPRFAAIRDAMVSECYKLAAHTGEPEALRLRRNDFVTAAISAADEQYLQYERSLLENSRNTNFAASLSIALLTAIAGVSGNVNLARGFTTAAGLINVGNKAYTTDQLLNQTVAVLQTQMEASRANRLASILSQLSKPYADWTFCSAMSAVQLYEQAGTLNAALTDISASATQAREAGNARVEAVQRTTYARGPLWTALQSYVYGTSALSPASQRGTRALNALQSLENAGTIVRSGYGTRARLGMMVAGAEDEAVVRAVLAAIRDAEPDPEVQAVLNNALNPPQ